MRAQVLGRSGRNDEAIALLAGLKSGAEYAKFSLKTLTVEQTVHTLLSFNDMASEDLYMASQKMMSGNTRMANYYLGRADLLPHEKYDGKAVPVNSTVFELDNHRMYQLDLGMRFLSTAVQAMQAGDILAVQSAIASAGQCFTGGGPSQRAAETEAMNLAAAMVKLQYGDDAKTGSVVQQFLKYAQAGAS